MLDHRGATVRVLKLHHDLVFQHTVDFSHTVQRVRIKASASEFRALVQEFTGQDAEWPESNNKKPVVGEDSQTVPQDMKNTGYGDHDRMLQVPGMEPGSSDQVPMRSDLYSEPFDYEFLMPDDHHPLEDFSIFRR
ncbi:hypothetical protein Nepgr_009963 [Nepenthes gracilis]|uniref:VQ domain-containing protein n=1 Tax=Nepenthes gracilis TaxID=150966 RepID=A0AAD3SBI8_NEPGR|nr:hypothetical protein Nepgr_009963 [Nepenthes gracilis]